MKIKLKADMSGTRNGQDWPARGEVFEVDDDEGAELCAAGLAEPVASKAGDKTEKAVAPEPETRVSRASKAKE